MTKARKAYVPKNKIAPNNGAEAEVTLICRCKAGFYPHSSSFSYWDVFAVSRGEEKN